MFHWLLLLWSCLSLQLPSGAVKRVIDGDTFILYSVNVTGEDRVRILGVDAPETGSGPAADSATAYTRRWLATGDFTITACKRDSFGRLLAIVARGTSNLADELISHGWGVRR